MRNEDCAVPVCLAARVLAAVGVTVGVPVGPILVDADWLVEETCGMGVFWLPEDLVAVLAGFGVAVLGGLDGFTRFVLVIVLEGAAATFCGENVLAWTGKEMAPISVSIPSRRKNNVSFDVFMV